MPLEANIMNNLPVLIVEDDPDHSKTVIEVLKNKANSLLEDFGEIDFLQAHTIDEAISSVIHNRPSLAIVDSQLGGDSKAGYKFIETTKNIYPDCLFVIITAFPESTTAERSAKCGAAQYLIKPYSPLVLVKTVFTLLELAASRKALHHEGMCSAFVEKLRI